MTARILAGLVALLLAALGAGFLVDPLAGAARFGLQPEGIVGLNSLRGDFGGLFVGSAALILIGLIRREPAWLLAVAVLMASIAVGRFIGFILDGFAGNSLPAFGLELVFVAILLLTARVVAR